MKLQVVMDTNVMISGVLWRGIPFELLRWAEEGKCIIYTSLEILSEVYRVIHHSKFQQYVEERKVSARDLFDKIASLCTVIQVERQVEGACRDKDDDKFISCALVAGVEFIISGDKHLLELGAYQSIRILTAREFYQEHVTRVI